MDIYMYNVVLLFQGVLNRVIRYQMEAPKV